MHKTIISKWHIICLVMMNFLTAFITRRKMIMDFVSWHEPMTIYLIMTGISVVGILLVLLFKSYRQLWLIQLCFITIVFFVGFYVSVSSFHEVSSTYLTLMSAIGLTISLGTCWHAFRQEASF